MINIIEVKAHLAQALDISNESGSIDKLAFYNDILSQVREGSDHKEETYTVDTCRKKYAGSIVDSTYRQEVSNISGQILELEYSIIESFEFNWIQLYATFERVLRSFGLPHIPFTHYTEKGETWGNYTIEQREALSEKINVYSNLRSYFKYVCNQFSDENKSKIEQAIHGVECMHYAKDAYLNNHIQGTGVYLMRAATYKSNLALQSNERLAKIGKSTTQNSKKNGEYAGKATGRPSLYEHIGNDVQSLINKIIADGNKRSNAEIFRKVIYRINSGSDSSIMENLDPSVQKLVLKESTLQQWLKEKKISLKKV